MKIILSIIFLCVPAYCTDSELEHREEAFVAERLKAPDHIVLKDKLGKRMDLGVETRWRQPLSLDVGPLSEAVFSWGAMSLRLEKGGEMLLGSSVDELSFPNLSEFRKVEKGDDLFLLSGTLNIQLRKSKKEKELRVPSHLLSFRHATFRLKANKEGLRIEVLEGKVQLEDLWFFPGEKFTVGAMEFLSSSRLKGNVQGTLSEKATDELVLSINSTPEWLRFHGLARNQAVQKIESERLSRRLDQDLAAERRVETSVSSKEAFFRVDY